MQFLHENNLKIFKTLSPHLYDSLNHWFIILRYFTNRFYSILRMLLINVVTFHDSIKFFSNLNCYSKQNGNTERHKETFKYSIKSKRWLDTEVILVGDKYVKSEISLHDLVPDSLIDDVPGSQITILLKITLPFENAI